MKFSLGQVVGAAVTSLEKHWKRLIAVSLLAALVSSGIILSAVLITWPLVGLYNKGYVLVAVLTLVLLQIYALVLTSGISLGYIAFVLSVARDERPSYKELFRYMFSWRSVQAVGIVSLAVGATVLGLLCLIVPGLIALARFFPSMYLFVDQPHGIVDTLRESNRLVKGATIRVLVLVYFSYVLAYIPIIGTLIGAHLYIALLEHERKAVSDV